MVSLADFYVFLFVSRDLRFGRSGWPCAERENGMMRWNMFLLKRRKKHWSQGDFSLAEPKSNYDNAN